MGQIIKKIVASRAILLGLFHNIILMNKSPNIKKKYVVIFCVQTFGGTLNHALEIGDGFRKGNA